MKPAEVDQTKLRANFFNSIAASTDVASIIAPAVGLSIGAIEVGSTSFLVVASACGFWCMTGFVLHLLAYRLLGKLE